MYFKPQDTHNYNGKPKLILFRAPSGEKLSFNVFQAAHFSICCLMTEPVLCGCGWQSAGPALSLKSILFISVSSYIIYHKIRRHSVLFIFCYNARPSAGRLTLYSVHFNGKKHIFVLSWHPSEWRTRRFAAVDIENIFLFIPFESVCVELLIRIFDFEENDIIESVSGAVAVIVQVRGY